MISILSFLTNESPPTSVSTSAKQQMVFIFLDQILCEFLERRYCYVCGQKIGYSEMVRPWHTPWTPFLGVSILLFSWKETAEFIAIIFVLHFCFSQSPIISS